MPIQTVVVDKPYRFIAPHDSRFWPWFVGTWIESYLSRSAGLESHEIVGAEKLKASFDAGHGILLAPNHPRPSDPMSMALLVKRMKRPVRAMASSHIFHENWLQGFMLPRIGAFSVYREGMDRESLKVAIDTLVEAKRPLVVFAEGVITRTNDRLIELQDGVSFMAHSAAKQRAALSPAGQVVAHAVAYRYTFRGDLEKSMGPVLDRLEEQMCWLPRREASLLDRVVRLGHALLVTKEVEYFGEPQKGPLEERLSGLLDRILGTLEKEWVPGRREPTTVLRVKALRKAIVPKLLESDPAGAERQRLWNQIYQIEVAQQIFHFPADYLGENPTADRLIETVERYEEIMGHPAPTVHRPLHLRMEIGDAIRVPPVRDRKAVVDPLMERIRQDLTRMLGIARPVVT